MSGTAIDGNEPRIFAIGFLDNSRFQPVEDTVGMAVLNENGALKTIQCDVSGAERYKTGISRSLNVASQLDYPKVLTENRCRVFRVFPTASDANFINVSATSSTMLFKHVARFMRSSPENIIFFNSHLVEVTRDAIDRQIAGTVIHNIEDLFAFIKGKVRVLPGTENIDSTCTRVGICHDGELDFVFCDSEQQLIEEIQRKLGCGSRHNFLMYNANRKLLQWTKTRDIQYYAKTPYIYVIKK